MERKKKQLPGFLRKSLHPYEEEARQFAEEFAREAGSRFDARDLRYDLDSVRSLDKVCRFNRKEFDDGLILKAGFFFGELLRRVYGGRYRWDARLDALSLRLDEAKASEGGDALVVFPLLKVRNVIAAKDPQTLEEYVMILAKRLTVERERRDAERRDAGQRGRGDPAFGP